MAVLTLHVVTGTIHTEKPSDARLKPFCNQERVMTESHTREDQVRSCDISKRKP